MASVPRLNRPQVRPTAEPAKSLGPNLAERAGAALQQTAGELQAFGREVQRLDEIRVNEALTQFAGRADELTTELSTRRGMQAAEGLDPFRDKLTVSRGDIEAGLSTENQRRLFAAQSERFRADAERRAFGYVQGETRRVDAETFDALNRTDLDRVATAAREGGDPTDILREMDRRTALFGDRQGWTPEMIADARKEAQSTARTAQLTAMANTENEALIQRARETFAKESGSMTERDRQTVERVLEDAGLRATSQRATEEIILAHPDDEAAALAEARSRYTGKTEDEVVSRIKIRFDEQRQAKEQRINTAYNTALGAVERGEPIPDAARTLLLADDPGKLNLLRTRQRQVANGTQPVTDWDTYERLFVEMTNEDLAKVNPSDYRTMLSDSDYKQLVDRVANLRQTGGRGDRGMTPGQVTTDLLVRAREDGLIPRTVRTLNDLKKSKRDAEAFERLNTAVQTALNQRRAANNNIPLTGTEQREVVNEVIDDEVMATGMFGRADRRVPRAFADPRRFRELTAEERVAADRTPIRPNETLEQYWDRLVQSGLSPDSANVLSLNARRPNTP